MAGGNRRILVVEDDFLTAEGYRAALAHAGYAEVRLAATAAAALREAARFHPALAIVDLQLGAERVEHGLGLVDALMRGGVGQVLIATGYDASLVDLSSLVRAPAAVLGKPILAAVLVAAVRRCLGPPDA